MRKLSFILVLMINSGLLLATEQEPDFLHYKGKKLALSTGWGHPSPLQTYYSQNNIKYPFTMLSTANYRGHVAIWEISDDHLFLKAIQIEKAKYKPMEFNVKSMSDSLSSKDKVFADWFSGVIIGEKRIGKHYWKVEKSYFFYVRYGKVIDVQELTQKDYKKIENKSERDRSNHTLMAKYSMLQLNYNYICYYFRIHGRDTISFGTKGGYLSGNSGLSPVLLYFNNDHMNWPYNWENSEKSGAPFCTWIIKNDSLLLTNIELHTGADYYSINKYPLELIDIFPDRLINHKVFGNWISGIYIIHHGINVGDDEVPGYFEFKPTEYTYMRLADGIVKEKYTVPSDFDFYNIPEETEDGLKKIFDELKN